MDAAVLVPMIFPGSLISMRKRRAARLKSASAEIPIPGQRTPPRYSPRSETASKFRAVPKSTATHGPPYFSNAATLFTMLIRAYFQRIIVMNGHAGFDSRLDEQRGQIEIALGHSGQRGI